MPADYDSTARALALDISPPLSPIVGHPPLRPSWHRSTSSNSAGRRHSAYVHGSLSFRDKAIDAANQLYRRAMRIVDKMSLLQRVAAGLVVLVGLVFSILFFVYNEKIFTKLEPIAADWKNLRAGWLISWALVFVTAFPPVIGYSTSVTLAGFVYGFPVGYMTITWGLRTFHFADTFLQMVYRCFGQYRRFPMCFSCFSHPALRVRPSSPC